MSDDKQAKPAAISCIAIENHGFAFIDTATMKFIEAGGRQVFRDIFDLRRSGGSGSLIAIMEAEERKIFASWADEVHANEGMSTARGKVTVARAVHGRKG